MEREQRKRQYRHRITFEPDTALLSSHLNEAKRSGSMRGVICRLLQLGMSVNDLARSGDERGLSFSIKDPEGKEILSRPLSKLPALLEMDESLRNYFITKLLTP